MTTKRLITIIALAAAAAAHAGMTPQRDTVRVYGTTEVDMVWTVTTDDGETFAQRILVSGCAAGTGELTFVDDNGTREYDSVMVWTRNGTQLLDDVARTTCKTAEAS